MTSSLQPASLSAPAPEMHLAALLSAAAIAPIDNLAWIRITGDDRLRWLNGMVTNSVLELKPGQGNYNFFLSAQGRIQGDAYIFAEPEALLLQTGAAFVAGVVALLDKFIIMDDVELAQLSPDLAGILVAGPHAPALLDGLGIGIDAHELAPLQRKTISWRNAELTILHAHGPIVPRFELWANPASIATLVAALEQAGATPISQDTLEHLRLLEGTPRYGVDIRDRELPQETAQARALHFSKGCYLGQEIVERIRSRGNVHRIFSAFRLEGSLPPTGTLLESASESRTTRVGELTSTALVPLSSGPLLLGLGYIRREVLSRPASIIYPGGIAIPIPVPFTFADHHP